MFVMKIIKKSESLIYLFYRYNCGKYIKVLTLFYTPKIEYEKHPPLKIL